MRSNTWEELPPLQELENAGFINGLPRVTRAFMHRKLVRVPWWPTQRLITTFEAEATSMHDRLMICGGYDDIHFLRSAESYDPIRKRWPASDQQLSDALRHEFQAVTALRRRPTRCNSHRREVLQRRRRGKSPVVMGFGSHEACGVSLFGLGSFRRRQDHRT